MTYRKTDDAYYHNQDHANIPKSHNFPTLSKSKQMVLYSFIFFIGFFMIVYSEWGTLDPRTIPDTPWIGLIVFPLLLICILVLGYYILNLIYSFFKMEDKLSKIKYWFYSIYNTIDLDGATVEYLCLDCNKVISVNDLTLHVFKTKHGNFKLSEWSGTIIQKRQWGGLLPYLSLFIYLAISFPY